MSSAEVDVVFYELYDSCKSGGLGKPFKGIILTNSDTFSSLPNCGGLRMNVMAFTLVDFGLN